MNSRRIRWTWLGISTIAAVALLLILWQSSTAGDPMLSAREAELEVLKQYPGNIEYTKLENGQYKLQLRSRTGLYQVVLDARTGSVKSIQQIEKTENMKRETLKSREEIKTELRQRIDGQVDRLELIRKDGKQVYEAIITNKDKSRREIILDPHTGDKISTRKLSGPFKDGGETARLLTEKEASKLALAKIPGVVDDVELRGTKNGVPYYLIEIELTDGREATVEVNAISGEVRSVTWDSDKADDDGS